MKIRVIDGSPFPASIAPYVYLVLRRAGHTATAGLRTNDPAVRAILHAHGKHTQHELVNATAAQRAAWGVRGTPNPEGHSEHELRSDAGQPLQEHQVGVDSGTDGEHDKAAIEEAARHYGWRVHHPYPSGLEGHHWQFSRKPHPHSLRQRLEIRRLRRNLPRR